MKVLEQVLVKEEVRRLVVVPAVYENREAQVQVESARVVLESCRASSARAAGAATTSPQAKCARELPPRFQTLTRRVLVQAETTREEVTPAQFASITKWVLETPARALPETLPATTRAVAVTEVARLAEVSEHHLAPPTTPVQLARHEGMPQLVWRRARCETDAQAPVVSAVQAELKGRGLDVGTVDGKLGRKTMSALMEFQRWEGLAMGLLTYESLGRLGL